MSKCEPFATLAYLFLRHSFPLWLLPCIPPCPWPGLPFSAYRVLLVALTRLSKSSLWPLLHVALFLVPTSVPPVHACVGSSPSPSTCLLVVAPRPRPVPWHRLCGLPTPHSTESPRPMRPCALLRTTSGDPAPPAPPHSSLSFPGSPVTSVPLLPASAWPLTCPFSERGGLFPTRLLGYPPHSCQESPL